MKLVGYQYNRSPFDTHRRRLSPSLINRITLMDKLLREQGMRFFLYSPHRIVPAKDTVAGFVAENGGFAPTEAKLPAVNGNWTYQTRKLLENGMGYAEFLRWVQERGIGVYVPHAFSELMANKLDTYKLVRAFHGTLHPHCEAYTGRARQLERFIESGPLSFLKPRTGSKGERIITLKRGSDGLTVTAYRNGTREERKVASLSEVSKLVRELMASHALTKRNRYVIQQGVETMRHDGSTFDIRVTMLNDGDRWHWLHEARRSREGSDVSNVKQGGRTVVTEELLFDLLGNEGGQQVLYELQSESFGLAAYLERLHPGDILEVAFDFVVDREGRLRLLEINTKPGLAGIGADVSVLEKRPEHEPLFERWVYPHTRHLAHFLMRKVERGAAPERR